MSPTPAGGPPVAGRGTLQQVAGRGVVQVGLPDAATWRAHVRLLASRAERAQGRDAARLHHQRAELLEHELNEPLRAAEAWAAALKADPSYPPARLGARHHALAMEDRERLGAHLTMGLADDEDRAFHAALWALRWPDPARVVRALADAPAQDPLLERLALVALPDAELLPWLALRADSLSADGRAVLRLLRLDLAGGDGAAVAGGPQPADPLGRWLAVEAAGPGPDRATALGALALGCDGPTAGALWYLASEAEPTPAGRAAALARAAGGSLDDVIALQAVLSADTHAARTEALRRCRVEGGVLQATLTARAAWRLAAEGAVDEAWHLALAAWQRQPAAAARLLERLAVQGQRWHDWATLRGEGPPSDDPVDRALHAAVAEHALADPDAARAALGPPDDLAPHLAALRAAQRLAPEGDGRAMQIEARAAAPDRQVDLFVQVARGFLAEPTGLDKALTYLFWVLDHEPEHPTALRLLVHACQAGDRVGPLAEALVRWLALVEAPEERVPALRALAHLLERTGQPAGDVADLLAEAAALQPDAPGLEAELARALAAAGRGAALVALYQRRLAHSPPGPARAALGLRLGLLYEGRLADPAAATDAYVAALDADPDDDTRARLVAGLARLAEADEPTLTDLDAEADLEFDVPLTDPGAVPDAADEFEALLLAAPVPGADGAPPEAPPQGSTRPLPRLAPPSPLPVMDRAHGGEPAAPARRTPPPLPPSHRGPAASPALQPAPVPSAPPTPAPTAESESLLGDFLGAEISRVPGEDPARAAVRRRLRQNRQGQASVGEWADHGHPEIAAAVAALSAADDVDGRFAAAEALARAYEAHGHTDDAVRAWKAALGWRAGAPEAIDRLEALYRASDDAAALAALLMGKAHRTGDPERRRALLVEAARLHMGPLADPGQAVDALRAALVSGPPAPALVAELAEALRQARRWPEYVAALKAADQHSPRPDDPDWTLAVGRVHLYDLDDAEAALPFVVSAARALPDRVDVAADVAEARAALGQLDAAVRLLSQCIAGLEGPGWAEQRATLNQRLARLLEGRGADPERARAAWRAAIEDGVRDPAILDRCERSATQAHDWDTLAVVLRAALDEARARQAHPAEVRDLTVRLGHLLARRLDRPREAAAAYVEGYQLDPSDLDVFRVARGLVERLGLPTLQVQVYRAWLGQAPADAPDALGVGLALVTALEEAERPDEAVAEISRLAEVFPDSPAVIQARERVLRAAGDWATLVSLYQAGAAAAADPLARAERLRRLAQAQEVGLRDLAGATATWRAVLDAVPGDAAALRALARLLEARKAWAELLEISEIQLADTPAPRQRAQVLFRMGSLLETQLADPEAAAARYRQALDADPRCFPALHGLRDLAAQAEDWPAVIDNLRAELPLWDAPKERSAVLARIGEIHAERLDDPQGAQAHYREALATWPESVQAARYLADRAFEEGRAADAAPLFQMLCNQALDKWPRAARADLFHKRGATACQLGRTREALESLKLALEFQPAHLAALEGLVTAAGEPPTDEDRATVDAAITEARAALPDDPSAQADVDRICGQAAEARLDPEAAADWYRRAADARPGDLDTLQPLVDLHVTWRQWSAAAGALRAFSDRHAPAAPDDPAARARCVEALMREGALWTDLAGEPARGAACYKRVAVLEPSRRDALWRQAECHVLQGDFAQARRLMRGLLAHTGPIPARAHAQALFYLGRIEQMGFEDGAEAERQYRRALTIDPQHPGALLALLQALDARGDAEGLAQALADGHARIDAPPEDADAAALRTFVAGLRLRRGDNAEARRLLDPMARGRGPGFRAARFALVQVHTREGDTAAALHPLMTLLDDDVTDVDALQTLAELLARRGDEERHLQVLSVLALYKALEPAQRETLEQLQARAHKRLARPGALSDDALMRYVVHPSFQSPLVRLAHLCGPQLAERFSPGPPPDLANATRITGRRHPFSFQVRTLQGLMGAHAFDLYFAPDHGEPVGVWPADPPLIVLGQPALDAPDTEQLSHLARALFYTRAGLSGLFNLGYRRRLALFATLDALFVPGAREADAAHALIEAVSEDTAAQVQRIVEVTGRMTLPSVFTGEAVMAGVSSSADRACLVACGSLRTVAEGLLRAADQAPADLPTGEDLTWAVRSAPRLRDLVKYALSEAYVRARRSADLAIDGN